jgi:lipoprotein NlpI
MMDGSLPEARRAARTSSLTYLAVFLFGTLIDGYATAATPQKPAENYQGPIAEVPLHHAGDYWNYQRADGTTVRFESKKLAFNVEFPLWVGKIWKYRTGALPGGQPQTSKAHRVSVDITCEVTSFKPIAVEAGIFDAFECRCECDVVSGRYERYCGEWTVWYAPQVKNVLKVKTQSTAGMFELADYNIPDHLAPPKTSRDFYNRGLSYRRTGEHDRAIDDFEEAIRLNPTYADSFNARGLSYANKKDYDRAIQDYNEALRLNPTHVFAFNNRGNAYLDKKQPDLAIADYDRAIAYDSNYSTAYFNRARAYSAKKDDERALQEYDMAIRINPKYATALNNRGNIYRDKNDYDRAIQDYDEAIRVNPNYALGFRNRGRARFYQGQFGSAAQDLAKAAELQPDNLHTSLWLYISETRAGQNGRPGLESRSQKLDLNKWPGPVIGFYLSKIDETALYAATENSDPKKKSEQMCEANFYAAEARLLKGAIPEAIPLLRVAEKDCPPSFIERRGASAELKRLMP